MLKSNLSGNSMLMAKLESRYSFTVQFLAAATHQARLAYEFESKSVQSITEEDRIAHRGFIVGAIMQSAAALESEIWDITHHGPGYHLGSNGIDHQGLEFLRPLSELIDREKTLERFALVLHLLGKKSIQSGSQPWQDTKLLISLRNELVHYKSFSGDELERSKLIKASKDKKFSRPAFIPANGVNFFPHQCLSASCASWSVKTCVDFIDKFYERLGIKSRLEGSRKFLNVHL